MVNYVCRARPLTESNSNRVNICPHRENGIRRTLRLDRILVPMSASSEMILKLLNDERHSIKLI